MILFQFVLNTLGIINLSPRNKNMNCILKKVHKRLNKLEILDYIHLYSLVNFF